jgi:hypothetical protein
LKGLQIHRNGERESHHQTLIGGESITVTAREKITISAFARASYP